MLKKVTPVPMDECPLNVLAKMGSKTANSWIFLSHRVRKKLEKTADNIEGCDEFKKLGWNATEEYSSTTIWFQNTSKDWARVYYIDANDIAFVYEISDPKYLFFMDIVEP